MYSHKAVPACSAVAWRKAADLAASLRQHRLSRDGTLNCQPTCYPNTCPRPQTTSANRAAADMEQPTATDDAAHQVYKGTNILASLFGHWTPESQFRAGSSS